MKKRFYGNVLTIGVMILLIGASNFPIIGTKEINNKFSIEGDSLMKSNFKKTKTSNWCCDYDIIVPDNYSTIQEAIDVATQGDCIYVRNDTYYENILIEGADKNGITLCGEDKNSTIIDSRQNNSTLIINNSANINITGFTIQNSSYDWILYNLTPPVQHYKHHGIHIIYSKNCVVYDNILCNSGNGIYLSNSLQTSIINNNIIYNLQNGLKIGFGSSFSVIKDNYIGHNGVNEVGNNGDGIEMHPNTGGTEIINNVIDNNFMDGIWIESSNMINIINNTIFDNGQMGINLKNCDDNKITDNDIFNNNLNGTYLKYGIKNEISYNNIFNNNLNGICLQRSDKNLIFNNSITDNNISGVFLFDFSLNNEISYNNILYNGVRGIYLYKIETDGDNKIKILHNNISYNRIGIDLEFTKNCVIRNNNITNNTKWGVILFFASPNKINFNQIHHNEKYNLYAWTSKVDAKCNWWGETVREDIGKNIWNRMGGLAQWYPYCRTQNCSDAPCEWLKSKYIGIIGNIKLFNIENDCGCN